MDSFERITDLSFFAVHTRHDNNLEITSPDWELLMAITASLLKEVQRHVT